MIILELNEFNPQLLATAAHQLNLPSVTHLLNLPRTDTMSPDTLERSGLDPWVQWVSIHTGVPSCIHKVEHLAEAQRLEVPQLWEVLDKIGISSGVWGAMNARRGSAENCHFFFPDPWTWTERAHPEPLNGFLSLPRYYAQNYLKLSAWKLARSLIRTVTFSLRPIVFPVIVRLLPTIAATVASYGLKRHILFSLYDLVSTELFIRYCALYNPDLKILYLNSIAHLQHNHWTIEDSLTDEMKPCFLLLDRMLERLFATFPSPEPLVVVNAFSQEWSADREQFLYSLINSEEFLEQCGLGFARVEQMMTNDAHVFFDNEADVIDAERALRNSKIDGRIVLFDVRRRSDAALELFFQVNHWQFVPSGSRIEVNGRILPFYDLFEQVTCRTGEHVPEGCVFARDADLVAGIQNHEIFHLVMRHYEHV